MEILDLKRIKFIARPNSWFDEGTTAFLDIDGNTFDLKYVIALFEGIKDGEEDGELCSIFEFDWIDEFGNCLNSNIPNIDQQICHDNYIIEDNENGKKYNYIKNLEI